MTSRQREPLHETLQSAAAVAVLSAVWDHAPIARRDLGRLTGLAPSSVTRLARRLAEAGLIEELRTAPSTGGRPAMLLSLSDAAGIVIGVDLSGVSIRGAVFTPDGHQLASLTRPFQGVGEEAVLHQVEALIEALRGHPAAVDRRLVAIGVSVPGTVDRSTGTVVDVTHLKLRGFKLGPALEQRFTCPIYLEHDTTAAAYAEKHYGAGRGLADLIFITIASGIGAGLVLDDHIYRGEAGAAGELGHIVVDVDGAPCVCGKRGCLEAVASAPAFLAAAHAMLEQGRAPGLARRLASESEGRTAANDQASGAPGELTIEAVVAAAVAGDPDATALVEREADLLARAIGTITSLLDIRTVIVGGEQALVSEAVLSRVRLALPRYQLYSNPINLVQAQLGQDPALRGVSALAFRSVFRLADLNGETRQATPQAG